MKRILRGVLARGKLTTGIAAVVALTLFTASTAFAANGGNFILGVLTNKATAITKLTASIANPALHIENYSTGTGATALKLETAFGHPPMVVNRQAKVDNLNTDLLDGKDSTQFASGINGKANDSEKLDGFDSKDLPGTIANVGTFSGPISNIDPTPNGDFIYVFAGPTTTVTTTANQRLVGAAEAPLALSTTGIELAFEYGLCYQPSTGGDIVNFVDGDYSIGEIDSIRESYAATASVVPGAGTWKVGFCVANDDPQAAPIDDNDYVNGWVQVVNQSPDSAAAASLAAASENASESERK